MKVWEITEFGAPEILFPHQLFLPTSTTMDPHLPKALNHDGVPIVQNKETFIWLREDEAGRIVHQLTSDVVVVQNDMELVRSNEHMQQLNSPTGPATTPAGATGRKSKVAASAAAFINLCRRIQGNALQVRHSLLQFRGLMEPHAFHGLISTIDSCLVTLQERISETEDPKKYWEEKHQENMKTYVQTYLDRAGHYEDDERGRSRKHVPRPLLEELCSRNCTVAEIARYFEVDRKTIASRIQEYGIRSVRDKKIDDNGLDALIHQIKSKMGADERINVKLYQGMIIIIFFIFFYLF